jgi:23S rRNA (guanosine2251-2'-O)-methyltransferase
MAERLVVGTQPVREVLRAHGTRAARVLLEKDRRRLDGLERLAQSLGVSIERVPGGELDRLCKGATHQGAAAFAPELELHPFPNSAEFDLVLALDGVQDPQNFGAAVRSAVGVAGAPIAWAQNASAPLSLATFRASAGAIEHARLCRVPSLTSALGDASSNGYQVLALDAHADAELSQLDLVVPTVLVVGSEGEGLGRAVRRACTGFARLPLPRTIDSLNVSVAAALSLYEAVSQRARRNAQAPELV